ncbi:hypothetical protein QT711_15290 [Sporosarcina saromensis]|uniref:Heat induced stress protein YflT n=1 Tax=Sporosarcina saromensis TaxID=359365 RepID=A0ABU4GG32_9BACL|nr:hypothetical protein [Sporosarcina saromensis]MDW0114562.1 hypothetical protein [Sporosarcina saromensis]
MTKKHVGTFNGVDEAVIKISGLQAEGYRDEQISAEVSSENVASALEKRTSIVVDKMTDPHQEDRAVSLFIEAEEEERDSSAELTESGEVLSSEDHNEPRDANSELMPRINTTNL